MTALFEFPHLAAAVDRVLKCSSIFRIIMHRVVTMSSQTLIGSNFGCGNRERHLFRSLSTALVDSKLAELKEEGSNVYVSVGGWCMSVSE